MVKGIIRKIISESINKLYKQPIKPNQVLLEHPENEAFGDLSSNISLRIASQIKKPSLEIAKALTTEINKNKPDFLEKIAFAPPGFINFTLKISWLADNLNRLSEAKTTTLKGKQIMVEYAHPNTHKAVHIGHLRNLSLGEAIVRILEAVGAKVIRVNYQGDVGIHIAKTLWGMIQDKAFSLNKAKDWDSEQKATYMGSSYVQGNNAYEKDLKAKKEIEDINYLIYASAQKYQQEKGIEPGSVDYMKFVEAKQYKLDDIYPLWVNTRAWSLDYFLSIYKRVDTYFDRFYFESECLKGIDISYEALKKGVLKKSQGAVVFDGSKYGLHTRVFINSLGLPTYEGKELGLASTQFKEYPHLNKLIHVVTPEQTSFFKVTFKVEELLGIQKNQQQHLSYEWVKLKKGKMSSREGNIVLAQWLLDEAKTRIRKAFPKVDETTLEMIAVGAVKYSFLKVSPQTIINFDFDESISLEGNSGPYLQYTYARINSILIKASVKEKLTLKFTNLEELAILKWLYRFWESIEKAALELAPNHLAVYLYELCQRFNTFYNKHRIANAENETVTNSRIKLSQITGEVIKKGLFLLGIKAPEKM